VAESILIADDDYDVATAVEINLQLEGYEVHVAHDGREAVEMAAMLQPDLVILDVVMPHMDGFQACEAIRNDPRTQNSAIIMLTAKSVAADKLTGFGAGADDYIVKPFEPAELIARVRGVLRRATQMRDVSPLTRLPGNFRISSELERLVTREGAEFAVLYFDLNDFKSFNDYYGFLRGDEVIKFTARVLSEAMGEFPSEPSFLGHVGGDDFVMVVHPNVAEPICKLIVERFDAGIMELYDDEDRARGFIEVKDRRNEFRKHGYVSIAVGIASTAQREIRTQWEASVLASEMKSYAKRHGRSAYEIDRRGAE
jgi:diguanylate cyclase (GGDEF)-like protein